jgi:hypothetical protein
VASQVRTVTGVVLALTASLVFVGSAAAGSLTWTSPEILDERSDVYLADAAFVGSDVAVAWTRFRDGATDIRIKSSGDGGVTFSRTTVLPDGRGAAVAICDGQVNVVFVRRLDGGRHAVEIAFGEVGQDDYMVKRVIGGPGQRSWPDVACAAGRIFVSWYERDGDPFRRRVANALVATHDFGDGADLGLDRTNYDGYYSPRGLRVAAGANTAYAVFSNGDGRLRVKRWSIGAAPNHPVTAHPAEIIANGTNACPAEFPVIGVDKEKVAVAWERNASMFTRVSTTEGESWKPIRDIDSFGCGGIVDGGVSAESIAVNGSEIVLELGSCGFGYCGNSLLRTNDAFRTYSWESLWDGRERWSQHHLVGYVTVDGHEVLADAYGNGRRIRFRLAQ